MSEQECEGWHAEGLGGKQVALAFLLSIGAGVATGIGSLLPLFLPAHPKATQIYLAPALAFAAGVMLYISFVDIMSESMSYFSCVTSHNMLFSATSFFVGVILTFLLHLFLHKLEDMSSSTFSSSSSSSSSFSSFPSSTNLGDNNKLMSSKTEAYTQYGTITGTKETSSTAASERNGLIGSQASNSDEYEDWLDSDREKKRLKRMSVITGVVIALHNFPEGVATFVATLSTTSFGLAVAFAVAMHNIPEGVCVSMPLYYASGSHSKAILWSMLSGFSEPLGALSSYLLILGSGQTLSAQTFGILFGLVAGMMTYVTLKELLPTAHRYDSKDRMVSLFLFFGMIVMAASILLFEYTS
jgi:ZIP family zinc transporter